MDNFIKKQMLILSLFVLIFLSLTTLSGCNNKEDKTLGANTTDEPSQNSTSNTNPALKAADTVGALEKNIKSYLLELMDEQSVENAVPSVFEPATENSTTPSGAGSVTDTGTGGGAASDSASIAAPAGAVARVGESSTSGTAGIPAVSGTNLVEQDVDESDLVKSDGQHMFIGRQAIYQYNYEIRPLLEVSTDAVLVKDAVVINEPAVSLPADGVTRVGSFAPDYYLPTLVEPAVIRVMKLDNSAPDAKEVGLIKLPKNVNQILGLYFSKKADDGTVKQLIVVTSVRPKKTIDSTGSIDGGAATSIASLYFYQENNIQIISYDVTDPEQVVQQWDMEVEGYYQASRSVNGKLYLVSSKYFRLQSLPNFVSGVKVGTKDFEKNKKLIENLTVDDILPATWVNDEKLPIVQADLCLVPNEVSANRIYQASMLSVFTIPIDEPEKTQSLCTLESSAEVYVSPNAIYFTKGEYVYDKNEPQKSKNFTLIHKLRFTDDSVAYNGSIRIPGWTGWRNQAFRMSEYNDDLRIVVSDYEFIEKEVPIDPIKPLPLEFIRPVLVDPVSSDVTFSGAVVSASSTVSSPSVEIVQVEGNVKEKSDIKTDEIVASDGTESGVTESGAKSDTSEPVPVRIVFERRLIHKLLVIRESANKAGLEVISQLPNKDHPESIGKPGEDIYAVRFFGHYAYVVTFRRTDPLYAINLTVPESPFIEGELSIPGFSEYLHPVNENLLLGVGKQADDNGRVKGMKIALFDVTDKTNPITINELKLGNRGSSTALSYDYKAFAILSDAETGMHRITVPVNIFDEETIAENGFIYYRWSYSGLQLAEIDDGSVSTVPALTDAGILKAFVRTKDMQYHYVNQPRGLMVNDAVHYIENAKVWSAKWDSPKEVVGPN